jgi:hypothetical protein
MWQENVEVLKYPARAVQIINDFSFVVEYGRILQVYADPSRLSVNNKETWLIMLLKHPLPIGTVSGILKCR